jgi:hypothetical protein
MGHAEVKAYRRMARWVNGPVVTEVLPESEGHLGELHPAAPAAAVGHLFLVPVLDSYVGLPLASPAGDCWQDVIVA